MNRLNDILTNNRGNLYDFVCDNYYLLSKDELKDLCKEAFALLYSYAENIEVVKGEEKAFEELHKEYKENLKEYTSILDE